MEKFSINSIDLNNILINNKKNQTPTEPSHLGSTVLSESLASESGPSLGIPVPCRAAATSDRAGPEGCTRPVVSVEESAGTAVDKVDISQFSEAPDSSNAAESSKGPTRLCSGLETPSEKVHIKSVQVSTLG